MRGRKTNWQVQRWAAVVAAIALLPLPPVWGQDSSNGAEAFQNKVRLARTYFRQLQGKSSVPTVSGPSVGRVNALGPNGAKSLAISEITTKLSECRGAGFQVGGSPSQPGKTAGMMSFECLEHGSIFPIVEAIATLSDDGQMIEAVEFNQGSAMRWTPPPPGPSTGDVGYDRSQFEGYDAQSRALVATLSAMQTSDSAAKLKKIRFVEWVQGAGKDPPIGGMRMSQLLTGCTVAGVGMSEMTSFESRPKQHATRIVLKCDPRSSSRADALGFATFSKGKIDGFGVFGIDGYRFPAEGNRK